MEDNNQPLTLELDTNKVNLLLTALGELPAKMSFELINVIHSQVAKQLQAAPEAE